MIKLIPNDLMAVPTQPTTPLQLRLSHLSVPSLNINNNLIAFFFTEKIPFLYQKIATPTQLQTVVSLKSLLESEVILGDFALYTSACLREAP